MFCDQPLTERQSVIDDRRSSPITPSVLIGYTRKLIYQVTLVKKPPRVSQTSPLAMAITGETKRQELKKHPEVIKAVKSVHIKKIAIVPCTNWLCQWWEMVPKNSDGVIGKDEYVAVNTRIYRVLFGQRSDSDEAVRAVEVSCF